MPALLILLALLFGVSGSAFAVDQESSIFGAPIAAQPFDREPFREVRIPDWVWDTVGVGYTLSGQNEAQRQKAIEHGVTISELGFVDPFYAYYDSKLLKRRSPHVPADHVEKEVAAYKRLGLRILAVYPPTLQSEVYELHPDWRRVGENTREVPQIDLQKYPHGGMLCLLGPYGDFMIEVLAEIVEKFDVDAFSFDGLHYAGVCYCQHCRENFRRDTGGEIPNVTLEDPAFRRYQHWADRRMEDVVRRMQRRLKSIKPDVALVTWTTNAGRFGHFRDIPRNMPARLNLLLDAPDQEFWMDETNRGATIVPAISNAYIYAVTNHRVAFSEPYLMSHGNPYGKDSFPPHEIKRRMLLACTHGAAPSLAVGQPQSLQVGAYEALGEVKRRKPWLLHKRPERWAALLVSDNTRVFYGRNPGAVEERYLANVLGFFRATVEAHLPVTLINDWNLNAEDLSGYRVLILPNAACLDDRQAEAVREFVSAGGGVVATLDTGLCNEFGDVRDTPALDELFGIERQAESLPTSVSHAELDVNFARNLSEDYWARRRSAFDWKLANDSPLASARLAGMLGDLPVTFKGAAVAVRPTTGNVAASMIPKDQPSAESIPAAIAREVGSGRVVYLPAALDAAYYLYPYPYQRIALENAIRWAAGGELPVEVVAPMCVQATAFRQTRDGERLLVHLFNDVNTTAFHGLPNDDVPLREETIPIHDIDVRLRGYRATRAHLEPEGIEVPLARENNVLTARVPRLDIHSILVVELEP